MTTRLSPRPKPVPDAPREEPTQNQEEDLPSDGKDVEGEKLIDGLGKKQKPTLPGQSRLKPG